MRSPILGNDAAFLNVLSRGTVPQGSQFANALNRLMLARRAEKSRALAQQQEALLRTRLQRDSESARMRLQRLVDADRLRAQNIAAATAPIKLTDTQQRYADQLGVPVYLHEKWARQGLQNMPAEATGRWLKAISVRPLTPGSVTSLRPLTATERAQQAFLNTEAKKYLTPEELKASTIGRIALQNIPRVRDALPAFQRYSGPSGRLAFWWDKARHKNPQLLAEYGRGKGALSALIGQIMNSTLQPNVKTNLVNQLQDVQPGILNTVSEQVAGPELTSAARDIGYGQTPASQQYSIYSKGAFLKPAMKEKPVVPVRQKEDISPDDQSQGDYW